MQGLRTKEDKKFFNFFKKVQEAANEKGFVFFLDFGECRDTDFEEMIVDNLFGWLIPVEKAEDFEILFDVDNISEDWDKYSCWVLPSIVDNEVIIQFK